MDSPTAEAAISAHVAFGAAQPESNERRFHRHGTDQIAHFVVLDQDEEDRTCAVYERLASIYRGSRCPLCRFVIDPGAQAKGQGERQRSTSLGLLSNQLLGLRTIPQVKTRVLNCAVY